ncbi:hypothetical protein C8R46DRAFT_1346372, partial [Mycena filopes]
MMELDEHEDKFKREGVKSSIRRRARRSRFCATALGLHSCRASSVSCSSISALGNIRVSAATGRYVDRQIETAERAGCSTPTRPAPERWLRPSRSSAKYPSSPQTQKGNPSPNLLLPLVARFPRSGWRRAFISSSYSSASELVLVFRCSSCSSSSSWPPTLSSAAVVLVASAASTSPPPCPCSSSRAHQTRTTITNRTSPPRRASSPPMRPTVAVVEGSDGERGRSSQLDLLLPVLVSLHAGDKL